MMMGEGGHACACVCVECILEWLCLAECEGSLFGKVRTRALLASVDGLSAEVEGDVLVSDHVSFVPSEREWGGGQRGPSIKVEGRGLGQKKTYLICLLMVMVKRMQKYIKRIGQKTGMSKALEKVQKSEMTTAWVALCQNLNSGRRRMKGLNSSSVD